MLCQYNVFFPTYDHIIRNQHEVGSRDWTISGYSISSYKALRNAYFKLYLHTYFVYDVNCASPPPPFPFLSLHSFWFNFSLLTHAGFGFRVSSCYFFIVRNISICYSVRIRSWPNFVLVITKVCHLMHEFMFLV